MQLLLGRRGRAEGKQRGEVDASPAHLLAFMWFCQTLRNLPVCPPRGPCGAACQRFSASASVFLSGAAKHHFPLLFLFSGSGKNRRQSMLF